MSSEGSSRKRAFTGTERRRFGRYETLFRIAGGGMAEVYAARIIGEAGFEKVVALKRMLPTLAEDPRFVEMFLDEARLAANISSPHVVQTLDLGRADDDSLYLVMELVVGVPLAQLLREVVRTNRRFDPSVAVEIIAQAALGLHDAHDATTPLGEPMHIVHRDVSPQNILVDGDGRTRILDFGVARAVQRSSHTQTGEVKGKMAYFAPEQATGATLDRRVDIFALGIVAWECLAGRRLFKADNPLRTLQKITQEPIPTLAEVCPAIDPQLSRVVAKALERDRDRRYPTAQEFAQALRACLPEKVHPARVGAYVRAHGGETLNKLEERLRRALAGEDAPPSEAPGPLTTEDGALAHDREAVSHSQVLTTATPASAGGPPASSFATAGRALVTLGLLTLAAGAAFVLVDSWRGGGREPSGAPDAAAAPSRRPTQPPEETPAAAANEQAAAPAETPEPTGPDALAAPPHPPGESGMRTPSDRTTRRRRGSRRAGHKTRPPTARSNAAPATRTSETRIPPAMQAASPRAALPERASESANTPARMVLRGLDEFDRH